jgi:predicted helicase
MKEGGGSEKTTEDSVKDLFGAFETIPLVVDSKLKELPLNHQLTWKDFERLIARLIRDSLSGDVQNGFQYGRQGQTQHGIDIVAFNAATRHTFVFQCKHVKTVSSGEITKWVKEFLKGERRKGISKYFLCTSFSIETDTALVDEWKEAAFLLYEEKIDSALWDYGELQNLLRYAEPIVVELFGEAAAERFCVRLAPNQPTEYPVNYRQKFV